MKIFHLNCPARALLIVECPVHGIQEEQFAHAVDRLAVIDRLLVISVGSSVQPVLVLGLGLGSEGVLKFNTILQYYIF